MFGTFAVVILAQPPADPTPARLGVHEKNPRPSPRPCPNECDASDADADADSESRPFRSELHDSSKYGAVRHGGAIRRNIHDGVPFHHDVGAEGDGALDGQTLASPQ